MPIQLAKARQRRNVKMPLNLSVLRLIRHRLKGNRWSVLMVARQAGQIYAIAADQVKVSGAQSSDINATGMEANVRVARIIAMHVHRLVPRASADGRGIKNEKAKREAV